MLLKLKKKLLKHFEITGLISLILFTIILTIYFNHNKKDTNTYYGLINNLYFNKTLNHIISKLDPKYKKIKHKVGSGETFDKILENYSIKKKEIVKIKKSLEKKVNLNKLSTKQIIQYDDMIKQ